MFVLGKMRIECVCVWQDEDKKRLLCFTEGPLVQSATFNGHHNITDIICQRIFYFQYFKVSL